MTGPHSAEPSPSLGATLDALPLSRAHLKVWFLASLGFLLEALDLSIIGAVLPVVKEKFGLGGVSAGLLANAALIGYLIGVAVVGLAADRFGRARMMRVCVFAFCMLTLAAALSWP